MVFRLVIAWAGFQIISYDKPILWKKGVLKHLNCFSCSLKVSWRARIRQGNILSESSLQKWYDCFDSVIPMICNYFPPLSHFLLQSSKEYCHIIIHTALQQTVSPCYYHRTCGNFQFIAKTRAIQFVQVPGRTNLSRLYNKAVITVNGNVRAPVLNALKLMVRANLCTRKKSVIQRVDKKWPIRDFSYFNNFGFLRNFFLNYILPRINFYWV